MIGPAPERVIRPRILDSAHPDDCAEIEELRAASEVRQYDTLLFQLRDWVAIREPAHKWQPGELDEAARDCLEHSEPGELERWVFYPWSARLVRLLAPAPFRAVRENRNRYKITAAEQACLRRCTIGVVGLSVGHAVALTLAQEGVGGCFRLADLDSLDLSNLNRLRAGVHEIGEHKAVIAARHIAEIDPYVEVEIVPGGVRADNIEAFLDGPPALDLLVEECDDLEAKVALREHARRRGLPVLMETSDRGTLDVERFDSEPERPLLHGLIPGVSAADLHGLSSRQKVPYVLSILGVETLSAELRASMVEINQSLATWPQLASDVALGGAVVTHAARRILLGKKLDSGRYRIDLGGLLAPGAEEELAAPPPFLPEVVAEARLTPVLPPIPRLRSGDLAETDLQALVAHAILAPSGGNTQPWRFRLAPGRIDVLLDRERGGSFLDLDYLASYLALGAAVENLDVAATAAGLSSDIAMGADPSRADLVAQIRLRPGGGAPSAEPLYAAIAARVSNRQLGRPAPLDAALEGVLSAAAARHGAQVHLIRDRGELERLGVIAGRCDRLRLLSDPMRSDLITEVRWSGEETRSTGDGIDLATLEMTATDVAAMRVLTSPGVASLLRELELGHALEDRSHEVMEAASGALVITLPQASPAGYFQGGRALERVWLELTRAGIAVWPHGVAGFLFERVRRHGLSLEEQRELTELAADFDRLFQVEPGHARVMVLRLADAPPPTARSLRRPLESVLL